MNGFSKMQEWIRRLIRNRSSTDFFIVILVGILLMVIALPTGKSKEEQTAEPDLSVQMEENMSGTDKEDYRQALEAQLTELLEQMDGAGKCKVMITLSDDGVTYVDKNMTGSADRREETTVVYDTDTGEKPYVLWEEKPKVAGVVVVTQGGGNAKVVAEISSAVMSLFQLEAHKITVVKMSVQEE